MQPNKEIKEKTWHKSAVEILAPENHIQPFELFAGGIQLLRSLPADELQDLLSGSRSECDLTRIKKIRKILMIGRDTVLLTTKGTPPKKADPVFELARALGDIGDTNGRKKRPIKKARKQLDRLERGVDALEKMKPHGTVQKTQKQLGKRLGNKTLLKRSAKTKEKDFHKARREFRRVVHFGHIALLTHKEIDQEHIQFLVDGHELSTRYGEFHDWLLLRT